MKWTQAQKCWGSSKSGAEPGAGPKVGELPKSNACFNTWKLRPQTPFLHAISFHKDQLHWWQILISIHSNIILIIPSKVPFEGTLFLLEWLNHGVTLPWQALAFHQVARTQKACPKCVQFFKLTKEQANHNLYLEFALWTDIFLLTCYLYKL